MVVATADEQSGWELAEQTGRRAMDRRSHAGGSADSVLGHCLAKFGRVDGLFNASGLERAAFRRRSGA